MQEKQIFSRIQQKYDIQANWDNATSFIPKKGEIIIYGPDDNFSYERFKIGDGVTTVTELPFCIIDADNVVFNDDITITTAVGNIILDDTGSGKIPAKGKNLTQVFEAIWTEEKNPTTTQPSLTIDTALEYAEVGASVAVDYSVIFNPGSYSYGVTKADKDAGRSAGVSANSWSAKLNNANEIKSNSGTFPALTVTEGSCATLSVSAPYSDDDATPATNLGNAYSEGQIKAGTATTSKNLLTGYKPNFYGFKTTSIDLNSIDSSVVRAFGTNQKQTTTPVNSATCNTSWMQFFYAVPKGRKTGLTVKDSNNLPLTVNTKEVTVNHEGSAASTYTVFYINNDAAYGATKLTLTWS